VPPLLFLPFIENCFKHGINAENKIEVALSFENVRNKTLIFKVENSFDQLPKINFKQGIGIKNVKRRLELLFKNDFELHTIVDKNKYYVELKIPIK